MEKGDKKTVKPEINSIEDVTVMPFDEPKQPSNEELMDYIYYTQQKIYYTIVGFFVMTFGLLMAIFMWFGVHLGFLENMDAIGIAVVSIFLVIMTLPIIYIPDIVKNKLIKKYGQRKI